MNKSKANSGQTNVCSHCHKEKKLSDFGTSKHKCNGLLSWCRQCYKERNKKLYSYKCVECGDAFKRTNVVDETGDNRCNLCSKHKIMREHGGNTVNYTGTKNFAGKTYSAWKASAKKRGYEWNLTKEMVEKKYEEQDGICALSGIIMEPKTKSPYRPSIDRIDSSKGYVNGNFQFICSMVNVMKNKFDEENFIRMCYLIGIYSKK